ncbi:hypothetical protein NKG05_10250 [Oerskovia sp. M15]
MAASSSCRTWSTATSAARCSTATYSDRGYRDSAAGNPGALLDQLSRRRVRTSVVSRPRWF